MLIQRLGTLREFCSYPWLVHADKSAKQTERRQNILSAPKEKVPTLASVSVCTFNPSIVSHLVSAAAELQMRAVVKALRERLLEADRLADDCAICLNNPMETPTCIQNCVHCFCRGCIFDWVEVRQKCGPSFCC